MSEINRIKAAVREVFSPFLGDEAEAIIERSVWEGDPYGWSHGAVATISTEHGLPDGLYSTVGIEKWFEVSDHLEELYCSTVNGGVVAVHRVFGIDLERLDRGQL